MSLLRNTDGDGSINFQKASCTLDGCVKIWTSRVDSTATAVGKLMSGLAEETSTFDNYPFLWRMLILFLQVEAATKLMMTRMLKEETRTAEIKPAKRG